MTTPATRILSWQQLVQEADPQFARERLQPWIYSFSNSRRFYATIPLYGAPAASGLVNDGGFLFADGSVSDIPAVDPLKAGSVYSNGGFINTSLVTTYQPGLSIFYPCTLDQLILLGGGAWPLAAPASGSNQIWNNGGFACVA